MQKFEAGRKDAMETATGDSPLGYAEFHLRGSDGATAIKLKAYSYADLNKIVGRLPVNLVFEVHLYSNGVRVGDSIYRRQHTYVEIEQETGACLNLFNATGRASLPTDAPLNKYSLFDVSTISLEQASIKAGGRRFQSTYRRRRKQC